MPNHHHARIQDKARAAFSLALPVIMALTALVTTVAWAAPTIDGTDDPRLTATLTAADGGKEACGDGDVRLVCTAAYEGLEPTKRYKVTATLIDTQTGEAVEDANGNAVETTSAFSPAEQSGTAEMELSLDARLHLGKRIGAIVTVRRGRTVVVTRECSEDPVLIPRLTARASDATTGTRVAAEGDSAEVVDEVSYECLSPGITYVLRGTIRDAATGAMLMGDGRRPADGTQTTREFTPTDACGAVTMTYRFDASALEGRTIAVTEELRRADGGPVIATYDGATSRNEVRFPSLSSVAVIVDKGARVRDVLSYSNLVPGLEYSAEGTLHVSPDGESDGAVAIDEYGNPLTASATFTPEEEDGTVELDFDLTTADISNVVLETTELITIVGHVVASSDDAQTVSVPKASVTLAEAQTGLHEARATKATRLVATVHYENLPGGGSRTANVAIVDVQTGNALLSADGSIATAEIELEPGEGSGSVDLPIVVDARTLAGHSVTAWACVHAGGSSFRADTDEEDVVQLPELGNTLCDAVTNAHVTSGDSTATLCDTVTYAGLMPGVRHTLKVTLVDAMTGEPVEGGASATSVSFVPDSPEGTVAVSVPLVGKDLSGKTISSVETLACEDAVTAEHVGGRTEAGKVRVPRASALARSEASGDQEVPATERAKVNVIVSCENLQPGLAYEVACTLADADDGEDLGSDVESSNAVTTITPTGESASVEAEITLDARRLVGRSLVPKATVTLDEHALASCNARTLRVPSIATDPHAEGGDTTKVAPSTSAKIVDSVSYANLVPGREYVVEGELVDRHTGKPAIATTKAQGEATDKNATATSSSASAQPPSPEPADATAVWVTDDGTYHLDERCGSATGTKRQTTLGIAKSTGKTSCQAESESPAGHRTGPSSANADAQTEGRQEERPVRAAARFTPAKPNGTVDVTYEMDTTGLEGAELVALETLSRDGHVVVDSRDHADGRTGITVSADATETMGSAPSESMEQTGTGILPLVVIGVGIALAIGGILVARAPDERDGEDGE